MKNILVLIWVALASPLVAQTSLDESLEDHFNSKSEVPEEFLGQDPTMYEAEMLVPEAVFHAPAAVPKATTEVKKALPRYDRVFGSNSCQGTVYVEAKPDDTFSHAHILSSMGFEVACFKNPENKKGLIELDLSALPPSRYTIILEGAITLTREIVITDNLSIAQLK